MGLELENKCCLLYKNLDLLGKKWMVFLLLEFGKDINKSYRYNEFDKILPGVTSRAISMRLSDLIEGGLIVKNKNDGENTVVSYNLTQAGIELIPVLKKMQQWSRKFGTCEPYKKDNCTRCDIFNDCLDSESD